MDKDRIAGSAKDFAGKVEGAAGDIAGDAKTQASGRAREAAGTVQNLYGQAKDAARDAGDAAVSYAKDAYENSGDTLRDGSQGGGEDSAGQSARRAVGRRRHRLCAGAADDAPAAPSAAVAGGIRAKRCHSAARDRAIRGCVSRASGCSRTISWIPTRDAAHRSGRFTHLAQKLPGGPSAERPTLPGGRGGPGARGAAAVAGLARAAARRAVQSHRRNPCTTARGLRRLLRNRAGAGICFFGFGGAVGRRRRATVPSGATDATGVSPLACSRPTSRRGQAKSSARPAGGASGSPLTSVRAASASTAAGREPGPPSN